MAVELSEYRDTGKQEQKQAFIEMRAKGFSLDKCAKQLHLAKATLCNWSHELEEEIARLKAVELEALQEQYYLAKEGRIKLLGEQLRTIQEELKARSLADVPTSRLIELQLAYYKELLAEYVEPQLLSDEQMTKLKALK